MIKSALHPIRQLLRYLGFDVVRYRSDRDRQADLYQEISKLTGNVVSSGPFAGMHLTELNSWGGGDRAAKLLGYYEMELNPFLEESIAWQPDVVVNVGCAEGYFAVGLAMRVADARVIAFDVDGQAQAVCKAAANLNDLSVDVRGLCTGSILRVICETARRPFLLIDCEGGERELLIEESYDFANVRIIVECHDFVDDQITEHLEVKFAATHKVTKIVQGGRDPFSNNMISKYSNDDLWTMINEHRPETMHWLYLVPTH